MTDKATAIKELENGYVSEEVPRFDDEYPDDAEGDGNRR